MKISLFNYCQERLVARYGAAEAGSLTRILLEDAFGFRPRGGGIFLEKEKPRLDGYLDRLAKGEPLQYILGQADFLGLKIAVTPAVLIPRMETEELADWIAKTIKQRGGEQRILDIGTGSGCIPVFLKKKCKFARVEACDVSAEALLVAETNAEKYGLPIDFHQIDILDRAIWSILPKYDIVLSNPPYIPPSEKDHIPEHVLAHEPALALFAPEADPLVFYREIADFALEKLNKNGLLFFECNEFNAGEVVSLLKEKGFVAIELRQDMMGKDRMLRAAIFS